MKDFCEPPMTTSRPQPSISSGMVPRPVMASTTKIASVFLIGGCHRLARRAPRRSRSPTPARKRPCSGGPSSSVSATCSALTTSPYSAVSTVASRP